MSALTSGRALRCRPSFSKTATIFQRLCGGTTESALPPLSPSLPGPVFSPEHPWMPQELPTETLLGGNSPFLLGPRASPLPFWLFSRYYRWPSSRERPSGLCCAALTFFFEVLRAGLDPRPSDLWPFLTSESCWNPKEPPCSTSLPSSPSSSQLVRDHCFVDGPGSQESKEKRPWFFWSCFLLSTLCHPE